MKETRLIMGMPVTVEVVDPRIAKADMEEIYQYFAFVDQEFSTYKKDSAISRINSGILSKKECSKDMKTIFELSQKTKEQTLGYFDIMNNGKYDPSGLVKGWAMHNAFKLLLKKGFNNFYIDAGGDIQTSGKNSKGKPWSVGIRNPFNQKEIIKVIFVKDKGVATSGTYIRGQHIYDPYNRRQKLDRIVSITVIGPNIYEADRFATACFAMQGKGIAFIESLQGFEGYMINKDAVAIYTTGFNKYTKAIE